MNLAAALYRLDVDIRASRDGFTALRQVLSERSRTAQEPGATARFIQVLSLECISQCRLGNQ